MVVCEFALTGGAEGIYSVRAAGARLFGLIRVYVGAMGTDVFRVDQGGKVFGLCACAIALQATNGQRAITFE